MYNSGAGPPSSPSGPLLATACDPFRLQRLREGEPRDDKSVQANPPFCVGTYISNYRAYIDSAHFANMYMHDTHKCLWDARSQRYRETAVGAWKQR